MSSPGVNSGRSGGEPKTLRWAGGSGAILRKGRQASWSATAATPLMAGSQANRVHPRGARGRHGQTHVAEPTRGHGKGNRRRERYLMA